MASKVFLGIALIMAVCSITPSEATLSQNQKDELLAAHNFYRGKVNPIASNMANLKWDDELAALAQFWTVSCEIESNEQRHDQSSEFDYVGEIQAASANYTINLTAMVFDWYFEGRTYDFSSAACTDEDGEEDEEGCFKYTQLVWANTRYMGCGAYQCEELDGDGDYDAENGALLVVCYYGPGGGASGEQPYTTGYESCSACPSDLPDCLNNLCTESESGAARMVAQVSMATLLMIMGALSSLI